MSLQDKGNGSSPDPLSLRSESIGEREILHEKAFRRMISVERKRTERSRNPFLLMLLETGGYHASENNGNVLANGLSALRAATRETDVLGWYKEYSSAGVMFTELVIDDKNSILSTVLARASNTLQDILTFEQFNQITISFHFFPDKWDDDTTQRPSNPTLYPDLSEREKATRPLSVTKRAMDILGSALLLVVAAPVFLLIALAIKLSSQGPVLFRQRRIGQYGKPFTFLKFRSMYVDRKSVV